MRMFLLLFVAEFKNGGITFRVGKITCFCFNYNYNLKFSITITITIIQVQVIAIQLQWKDSQNIAINSLTYQASSFVYVHTVDLFCISIPDWPIKARFLSILVLPSIFV